MQINHSKKLANLRRLHFLADKLEEIREEVVFLGGCTTALFITDISSLDVRYTLDVDCIVDIISLTEYYKFEKKLLKKGFKKSIEDEIICRWRYDDLILDVMPTDSKILGFSNCWYKDAIKNYQEYILMDGLKIKVLSAPYFLATKLEAFKSRGNKDYMASQDFEDIVSVIDGRLELIDELKACGAEIKKYLVTSFRDIYNDRSFHDSLPGHFVSYGILAEDRIDRFTKCIFEFSHQI